MTTETWWNRVLLTVSVVVTTGLLVGACGGTGTGAGTPGGEQPAGTTSAGPQSSATETEGGGGGDDIASENASMAEARAMVEEYKQEPTYQGPTTPLDASKVDGKHVYFIAADLGNAFNQTIADNFTEAATLLGIETTVLNGRVDPTVEAGHVRRGIAQNVDGFVLLSLGDSTIPTALAEAEAAGIPVITIAEQSKGLPIGEHEDGQVNADTNLVGQLQVAYALVQSGINVNAIGYGVESIPTDRVQRDGQGEAIARWCPETCQWRWDPVQLSTFQTKLATQVQAALTSDPSINWLFPNWDVLATYVVAGVKAAGVPESVGVSSWNGLPVTMEMVKNGEMAMDIGAPLSWWGWAATDMIARLMAGQEAEEENLPIRIFDKELLDQLGTTTDEAKLYGEAYKDAYRELWGLGSGS